MQITKQTLNFLAILTAFSQTDAFANEKMQARIDAAKEDYTEQNMLTDRMQRFSAGAKSNTAGSVANRNQLMTELALERLEQSFEISAETTSLIGDAVDLNTGGLSLTQTDIAIPGNFPLDVAVTRTFKGRQYSARSSLSFADWQLDIPAISTSMLSLPDYNYTGSWGRGVACSGDLNPGISLAEGVQFSVKPSQYWSGDFINVPGQGSERILQMPGSTNKFAKNWKLECINSGGIEGYKATRSDGVRFTFDKLVLVNTKPAEIFWREMNVNIETPRYNALLQVSKIEDRFGNWVEYHYNSPGELSYILASDNRRIDIEYRQGTNRKLIEYVRANNRTWHYKYRIIYDAKNIAHEQLANITLPDGRAWEFDLQLYTFSELKAKRMIYGFKDKIVGEKQCLPPETLSHTAVITHPNGAQATFTMSPKRFGRSQVPLQFHAQNRYSNYDRCFTNFALTKKRLTGPGLSTMVWNYSYSQNPGSYNGTHHYDEGPASQALSDLPAVIDDYSFDDLKSTTVEAPDGSKAIHVFDRSFTVTENQKVAEFYLDTDGTTLLQSNYYKYTPVAVNAEVRLNYCAEKKSQAGICPGAVYENEAPHKHFVNKSMALITRYDNGYEADTFTTLYEDYNSYGQYTQLGEYSSITNKAKYTRFGFQHDLTNWLLNLPTTTEVSENASSWTTVSETTYYPATETYKSLPMAQYHFGVLRSTNSLYHSDGTLKLLTMNSPNLWVQYENYKRGKPQLLKLPKRYATTCTDPATCYISATQSINDDGTVSHVTTFNGDRTDYKYDVMRRLKEITPADTCWSPTYISYAINSGYFTQNISKEHYRKTNRFDALLRPILTAEWDNSDITATKRYTVNHFNAYNNPEFSSYPSASSTEQNGTVFEYDGLQRKTRHYNSITNMGAEYAYQSGNKVKTTDARGNTTFTSYKALGSPAQELITKIESPESVTTSIEYNLFDNITAISQGSITESRIYNAQQYLCRSVRPDVGHTAYSYNGLGQPIWVAKGASGIASSCDRKSVLAAEKVSYVYDNLGTLRNENYPDTTPDKTYQFDSQGNLETLIAGTAQWNYTYNTAGLLDSEELTLDNISWLLSKQYNTLGRLSSLTYPSGKVISFAPNALGQPTRTGDYVTAAKYYPNGNLTRFNYGNGLTFDQILDNQQRPESQTVQRSSTAVLSHFYQYDDNHNILTIRDLVEPAKDVTLTYDGLDRLDTASGFWGNGSFSYDLLGNVKSKVLGNQSLTYAYNTKNRLAGVTGNINRSFDYDSRGNVISNGVRAFSFNLGNQLISSGSNSYQYDGYNRRIKKSSNGKIQYTFYDSTGQLLLTDGDNGLTEYFYLGNKLIAKESKVTTSEDSPGYTGHLEDDDLQLTYMQARYYDPVIGRFYSNDPVDALGHLSTPNGIHGFNRYAYANNNPYKYTDPTGMSSYNPKGMVKMLGGQEGIRQARQTVGKIADASTLKVGVGVGLQVKAQNVPGVGSFDAGGSLAVSSVMTSDPNAQGIELSADAGLNASNASGTMSGQLQLGKAEALVQPQNGTVSGKTEGAKVTGTLSSNPTSVNNEGKVKVGAHMGLIKVELEVDTNKLD
ncbi:RHS repeat-associated core domain-containing protein [Pseudoalteromonas neustonica]|nr:RHS repeat-associated core domain-containing protein [Pseudoalteromonas neustonica]